MLDCQALANKKDERDLSADLSILGGKIDSWDMTVFTLLIFQVRLKTTGISCNLDEPTTLIGLDSAFYDCGTLFTLRCIVPENQLKQLKY